MPKVKKLKPNGEAPGQAVSVRWLGIKEDFLAQNLARVKGDPPYDLRRCAEAHKVSYAYLRQIAAEQHWTDELRDKLEERQQQVVQTLQGVALCDEVEIRTRQASYARLASSLAYQKLKSIKRLEIAKMTVRDAIELLKVGLAEERTILGLREGSTPPPPSERVLSDTQVFAVARRVIELRQDGDGAIRAD